MDNSERLATLGTQDTGLTQTKQKIQHGKLERWATHGPHQKRGVNLHL